MTTPATEAARQARNKAFADAAKKFVGQNGGQWYVVDPILSPDNYWEWGRYFRMNRIMEGMVLERMLRDGKPITMPAERPEQFDRRHVPALPTELGKEQQKAYDRMMDARMARITRDRDALVNRPPMNALDVAKTRQYEKMKAFAKSLGTRSRWEAAFYKAGGTVEQLEAALKADFTLENKVTQMESRETGAGVGWLLQSLGVDREGLEP